jgi:hypothetical protein
MPNAVNIATRLMSLLKDPLRYAIVAMRSSPTPESIVTLRGLKPSRIRTGGHNDGTQNQYGRAGVLLK